MNHDQLSGRASDFCLQNVQTSYWAYPDPYSMSIRTLSIVMESQRKLTPPLSSVKVQNKWSYTPLPLYAITVQTRTSLALLIPLHEIYKTVKLCMHLYIKYVHVVVVVVWQPTVTHHTIYSTSTCFIHAQWTTNMTEIIWSYARVEMAS